MSLYVILKLINNPGTKKQKKLMFNLSFETGGSCLLLANKYAYYSKYTIYTICIFHILYKIYYMK